MGVIKIWILALAPLLVIGCSSAESPPQKPPQKTVFDPLIRQEERARDVQRTIDQTAERERKAADAQERGDAAP